MIATGVYKIEHIGSGRLYIGSAINMKKRFFTHKWHLRKNTHPNKLLQNAWNKYEESSFAFEPLLICAPKDVIFYEQRLMDGLKSYDKQFGYNLRTVAESNVGIKFSEERRSAAKSLRNTPEYKAKVTKNFSGDRHNALTLIKFTEKKNGHMYWLCICDCGRECIKEVGGVKSGRTKNCGCINKRPNRKNAGLTKTTEYILWKRIKSDNHGCLPSAWKNFQDFLLGIGNRPRGHCFVKKNYNRLHSPSNWKWASIKETRQIIKRIG